MFHAFSILIAALCLYQAADDARVRVDVSDIGRKIQIIGKLGVPLHQVVEAEGVIVDGPFKGYEGGPSLRVQRVNGRATQEDIQIVVRPAFGREWGGKAPSQTLPALKVGQSFWMKGYETGGFVGIPLEVFGPDEVSPQTCTPYFHVQFTVAEARKIDPIVFGPRDFPCRRALLSGRAVSRDGRSCVAGEGWTVTVNENGSWPAAIENKRIETDGLYGPTDISTAYQLVDGVWRLVDLKDQVGQEVELRGRAWSMNGRWWFRYRGINITVDDLEHLPGWSGDYHGLPILIRGKLEQLNAPTKQPGSSTIESDEQTPFFIRVSSWRPLPALLSPERPLPRLGQEDQSSYDREPACRAR